MIDSVYIGVVLIGLLHGFEPGHGWPMAVLYSMKKKNAVFSATLSSSIIGLGHLVSSIAVVAAYVLLQQWLDFNAPWLKYAAAALLVFLAVRMFREKVGPDKQHGHQHPDMPEIEHEHEHAHPGEGPHTHHHSHKTGVALSLLGLTSFAFILGFAHEEEVALLALVAGGLNAWILMLSYSLAVVVGLIVATVAGVKLYQQFKLKLSRYESYIPKIGGALLLVMAAAIAFF